MERVRLAVVGIGNIAPLNIAGYLAHERCDVVALCDRRVEHASQMAAEWGIPRVESDLDAILADPDIDAVEILTPTHMHRDHVVAALEAGKHVSVQKPLANTVDEARQMQKAADAAGVVLRVSECFVHYPPLELARRLIAEGAIGKITNVRIRTVVGQTDSQFQKDLWVGGYEWRLDRRSPGGHLFDDMVHKYAMALWLPGLDIVSVQAVVRRRDLFFEPCATIFEYAGGEVLGQMEVSYAPQMWMRSSYYGADEFFEVQGDEGILWVTRCTGELLDAPPVVVYRGRDNERSTTTYQVDSDWGLGFRRASAHFVDCLLAGKTPSMTAEEAIKVLQLCFAVYEASNERRPVDPRTIEGSVTPTGWADW